MLRERIAGLLDAGPTGSERMFIDYVKERHGEDIFEIVYNNILSGCTSVAALRRAVDESEASPEEN